MTPIVAFQMLFSKSAALLGAKRGFLSGRRASLTCHLLLGGAFGLFFQALQTSPRSDHCVGAGAGGDEWPE